MYKTSKSARGCTIFQHRVLFGRYTIHPSNRRRRSQQAFAGIGAPSPALSLPQAFLMNLSSQPQRQQQQRQRQTLLDQALSHGPYLWSNQDVENALLWFPPFDPATAGNDACNESDNEKEDGCEFLRRLLHARGIWMPRPPRLVKANGSNVRDKKNDDKSNEKPGNDRKREETFDEHSKRKRRRTEALDENTKASKHASDSSKNLSKPSIHPSPLQAVLMGYYQLFLPPLTPLSSSSHYSASDDDLSLQSQNSKSDDNQNHGIIDSAPKPAQHDDADTTFTALASMKLQHDLSSIILARQHTNELYQASLNVTEQYYDHHPLPNSNGWQKWQGFSLCAEKSMEDDSLEKTETMSFVIDKYMTHPTTCLRRVYASSLFDRLMDLCKQKESTSVPAPAAAAHAVGHSLGAHAVKKSAKRGDATIDSNSAVHRFLKKLFGLATTNVKIQEVVLLMLVEPVRRLQIRRAFTVNATKHTTDKSEGEGKRFRMPLQSDEFQGEQESPDMKLFPMLTSICAAINVSTEMIERECSEGPVPALVQFILQTAPNNTSDAIAGPACNKLAPTRISWWSLPSPLLCAISQMYFPLACEYIRYWIDRAIIGHKEFFAHASSHSDESFQQSIQRIQQLFQTSQRLYLLGSRVFASMEKEDLRSNVHLERKIRMGDHRDEETDSNEGNDDFQKSLAWRAIRHAVFSASCSGSKA